MYSLAFSGPLVTILVGSDFSRAAFVLRFLSLSFLVIALHSPFSALLPYVGETYYYLACHLLGLVANLVANAILIPLLGDVGAVLASLVGVAAILAISMILYRRWFVRFWDTRQLDSAYKSVTA